MIPLSSGSENKKPVSMRNEKSNRKLKTSTRKPASKAGDFIKFKKVKHAQKSPVSSTQPSNLKMENDSTTTTTTATTKSRSPESKLNTSNSSSFGNNAETQYVNWSAIQGKIKFDLIDSSKSDFDVAKWVEWRTNLNEYLISNGASFFPLPESSLDQAKQLQSNQLSPVANNLKNGCDKKSYTLFGIPKAKLSVDYLPKNSKKVSELILEKEKQQSQIEKNTRLAVYSEKTRKIPGANVREKIKAFEGKASLADTIASKSQQTTTTSNSTFSTTITSSLISSANDSSKSKVSSSSKAKDSDKKDEPIYYNNDNPFRLIHAKWNRKASRVKKSFK